MSRNEIIVTPEEMEAFREFIDSIEQDIREDEPGFRYTDEDRKEVAIEIKWCRYELEQAWA